MKLYDYECENCNELLTQPRDVPYLILDCDTCGDQTAFNQITICD